MTPDEFVRAATAYIERKVRTVATNGTLWYALRDLIPPSMKRPQGAGKGRVYTTSEIRQFVEKNSPEGAVSSRLMNTPKGRREMTVVAPQALQAVLTYVHGKAMGVDFRAPWARLPEPLDIPAAA